MHEKENGVEAPLNPFFPETVQGLNDIPKYLRIHRHGQT